MTAAVKSAPVYTIVSSPEGFTLHRDGAPLKTPADGVFTLPTKALAEAIAEEWRRQGPKPDPASIPMTQLAATTIDVTQKQRPAIIKQLVGYIDGDLLCHRAGEPEELVKQQQKLWQPVLDWCAGHFDAVLKVGQGIMLIEQPEEGRGALRSVIESCDDFTLTGLKHAAEITHSLVLAMALIERHLNAEQVFNAAECEAVFQMQKWGEDPAALKRHESIRRDLLTCERWFHSLIG